MTSSLVSPAGGRFDFDDGGTYCGGWEDGKAHGHGICTGPKGQGEYSGLWEHGFEVSGVYCWPSGSTYEGQWADGKRHGLGVETRGRWIYRGEWTEGFRGRYGVRQSISSAAKYNGTWANGLQDGYGSETYADGGTFQGQWAKGMRHGYGVRSSAPFGLAAHTRRGSFQKSVTPNETPTPERRPEDSRGGFVLQDSSQNHGTLGRSLPEQAKRSPFKAFRSKGDKRGAALSPELRRSLEDLTGGSESDDTESSFAVRDEFIDGNVIETYMGEWKNDKRCGFGIAERSDGLKYEGEWYNNKKFGYGLTTYKTGEQELGKYKNNVLLMSSGKKHMFILRSIRFKERVEQAVNQAHRASQIALQKADIAISRTATARGKAEQADLAAKHAREDSGIARRVARQFAPEFQQQGLETKFASSQDSIEFAQHFQGDDLSHRSLYVSNPGDPYSDSSYYPEFDDTHLSPRQSALLDVFRNSPDRRPSATGFLRRPSAANLRRPSTIVELKFVPAPHEQHPGFIPNNPAAYHRQPQLSWQQIIDDHLFHYYEPIPTEPYVKRPAIDLTELSKIYGIPISAPQMEDEEGNIPYLPHRRSTMPTVLDPNLLQVEGGGSPLLGDGMVRTGSLYSSTRKEGSQKNSSIVNARKKSLPDISNVSDAGVLSREAIAALSSQRREAIRRQEEEAQRLKANPLLYLLSPEVWDWFASQQLVILVVVINVALGLIFFKVIL